MEMKEARTIKDLLEDRRRNPRQHKDHIETLEFSSFDGKRYRRFMEDYVKLDFSEIAKSQVREEEYDKQYCDEDLVPKITRDGILHYPLMVDRKYNLIHGHNRLYSHTVAFPGFKVPCLIISDPYEVQGDGTYSRTATNDCFHNIISQIKPNKPNENNPYSMADVAQQVSDLFKADPTFEGINPSGRWFESNIGAFDRVMDILHPNQFTHPSARTKIRKAASKGKSVIKVVEFQDWTHAATSLGWPPGVKVGKKKAMRKDFDEWVDPKDNTMITHITTAGMKEKEKVRQTLVDMYFDNTHHTVDGVKLLAKVGSPKTNPAALNKQRSDYVSMRLDPMNKGLKAKGWPLIKEVFFVKQLENPNDRGQHFILDKNNVFIKK